MSKTTQQKKIKKYIEKVRAAGLNPGKVPDGVWKILRSIMYDKDNAGNERYEYSGNAAAYLIGDPVGKKEYDEISRCCGVYEEVIEFEGFKYMIGFDYGH